MYTNSWLLSKFCIVAICSLNRLLQIWPRYLGKAMSARTVEQLYGPTIMSVSGWFAIAYRNAMRNRLPIKVAKAKVITPMTVITPMKATPSVNNIFFFINNRNADRNKSAMIYSSDKLFWAIVSEVSVAFPRYHTWHRSVAEVVNSWFELLSPCGKKNRTMTHRQLRHFVSLLFGAVIVEPEEDINCRNCHVLC